MKNIYYLRRCIWLVIIWGGIVLFPGKSIAQTANNGNGSSQVSTHASMPFHLVNFNLIQRISHSSDYLQYTVRNAKMHSQFQNNNSGNEKIDSPSIDPTGVTVNPSSICNGANSTLTVVGGSLGTGANWFWYNTSCGVGPVGSGPTIVVSPGSTTSYWVRAEGTVNTTSCAVGTVTVAAWQTPTVSISANTGTTICDGTAVTFTAIPTYGGTTPSYQWKLNGFNVGANSNTYANAGLINGDQVQCVLTSSYSCPNSNPVNSNTLTITVNPNLPVSLVTTVNPGTTICFGTNAVFTATVTNGGATPIYQWKLNGSNVGGNSSTYSNSALANGDQVWCIVTSSVTCPTNNPATSNTLVMAVNPNLNVSVSISANPGTTICENATVVFTATATNGGGSPTYQWKLNGADVGINSSTYTNSSLANGDQVRCVLTSSVACPVGSPANSNTLVINTIPNVVSTIVITSNQGTTVCEKTIVTFTATISNGGATPSFQWQVNGGNVGTNSNTYITNTLNNNDQVTCILTSSLPCVVTNPLTSNTLLMTVVLTTNVAVSVSVNPGTTVCTGSLVTFTATPTNPGATPVYQWHLNGGHVGSNNVIYSNASLANGDDVWCEMTPSVNCPSDNPAVSDTFHMVVDLFLPTADAGLDVVICKNSSTTLNASGGLTYLWSPAAGLSATNISNPVATPLSTTTYSVTVTNSCGSDVDEVIITVDPAIPIAGAGLDVTICAGGFTILQGSGSGTFLWSPATGLSSVIVQNPIATPTVTTTYTVSVTNACGTSTDAVIVGVDAAAPIANAGSDVSICVGNNTTLLATGGTSYSWSPAAGLSATNIPNPVASPIISTTYTVTVTNACGSSTDDVIITVFPTIPTPNAGIDVTICSGSSTPLNATGGVSYSWSPAAGLSATNIANPVANPTITTTYTVTVTNPCGSATDNVVVIVNSAIPVPNAGLDVTICLGTSTTLNATGGNSYAWSPGTGLSATNIANPIADPVVTTTYTVTVTNACGSATDDLVVTVNMAAPIANAGTDVTICTGSNTTLNASGGVSYSWSPATGLSATNISNPVADPTITTTYTVTTTNPCGSATDNVVVFVQTALPIANAGLDVTICTGSSTNLNASGGTSYAWSPGTGLSATNIANPVASPTISTTYTVSVTNACGTTTDNIIVTVNAALPIANAGVDVSICTATNTTLNASGGTSYAWSPGTGLSATNISNPVASPTITTTYTVSVTNSCGTTTDNVIVTVFSTVPTANAGSDVTICNGSSTNLSASGGLGYSWSPATGLSATNIANPTANPTVTTTYTVTVSNPCGTSTDNIIVFVDVAVPAANAGADVSICIGSNTTLNATGGSSYQWSPSAGLSASNISNPIANPIVSTTYIVTVTNACGSSTDNIVVTVDIAAPVADAGANVIICAGSTTNLVATGGGTYIWSPAGSLTNPNIANPVASPTVSTTYTVTVTNACGSDVDFVIVTVNSGLPVANAGADIQICNGTGTVLNATGGTTYLWSPSTSLSANNIANPTATPTLTTTYTVTVTNACGSSTDNVIVSVVNSLPIANAGSDVNICLGSSTTLNASGGVTYAWGPSTGLSATNIASPIATPVVSITYTVTVTNACGSSTDDIIVSVVSGLPTINAGVDVQLCQGESTTLNATSTGGLGYTWNPALGLSDPNIANPVATPASTTTYTVSTNNVCGTVSDNLIITINPLPLAQAGINQTINCNGAGVTIGDISQPGMVYSWAPSSGLSDPNNSAPIATPMSTTTYVVLVTNTVTGCTATDDVIVTVLGTPTANAGFDQTINCNTGGVTIGVAGNPANSYNWSPSAGLSDPNISNPMAAPMSTTTYVLTVTNSNGCFSTDEVIITVIPSSPANAGPDQSMDCGSAGVLIGSANIPGYAYTWSPSATLSNPNISNPVAVPSVTTLYTVTVTDIVNGCFSTDEVLIVVTNVPFADAGFDQSINCGGVVTIGSPSIPAITYSWSPSAGLSDPNIAQPVASPSITTTYTLLVSNVDGCVGTDEVVITILNAPVANAGLNQSIACGGSGVQIGSPNNPLYTYSWSPVAGLSSSTISNPMANPLITTTYVVTVTSAGGCFATDDVVVTAAIGYPAANAGLDQTINCNGAGVSIGSANNPAYTYSWSPSSGLSNSAISDPVATPLTTTTYTITVEDIATGCISVDQVVVTVLNVPLAYAGNDMSLGCGGGTVSLGGANNPLCTYIWSPTTGLSNSTISNPLATVSVTTVYVVTVTNISGCSSVDSVEVYVLPTPNASAGADTSVCLGSSIQLQASGGTSYVWAPATGLSSTIISNPIATPIVNTTYTVTVTNISLCSATDQIVIAVKPLPIAEAGINDSICLGSSVNLLASGGIGYQWSPAGSLDDPLIENPLASPVVTTLYTVTVTAANGCFATDTVTIVVETTMPIANAGPDTSICRGSGTLLNATGGAFYLWTPITGLSATNIFNPIASPTVTTTYVVQVTNACGSDNDAIIVNVDTIAPPIKAGLDVAICKGSSVVLNASGALTYSWSPAIGLSAVNIPNPIASPDSTTVYQVSSTNACGLGLDSVTVFVSIVYAKAGNDTSICYGTSVQLEASGGISFGWSPSVGLNDNSIYNPVASPVLSTVYTVMIKDTLGCIGTDDIAITVNSLPEVTLINSTPSDEIYVGQVLT
ncbi:MAG: hypothetical protein V2A54_01535, partial [Bacteroidota bacterium]